jgi:protein TonB
MSSADSVPTPLQAGRRTRARRKMDGLAYVEFGAENGAILVDLGEGGLGFQSVLPVCMNQALAFKFKIAPEGKPIEGQAEVAWRNESEKGGGLRFVELNADACARIREWAGVPAEPETAVPEAENAADANLAPESPAEHVATKPADESSVRELATESAIPNLVEENSQQESSARETSAQESPAQESLPQQTPAQESSEQESPAPEIAKSDDVPAPASEASTATENAQIVASGPEATESHAAEEPNGQHVQAEKAPADRDTLRRLLVSEAAGANTASAPTKPVAEVKPAHAAAEPTPALSAASIQVPEAALPRDPSAHQHSDVAKAISRPERTVAAAATPAKAPRMAGPEATNSLPAQKRPRKPTPAPQESSLPLPSRQESAVRGAFVQQPRRPAAASKEWEELLPGQPDELKTQAMLASQALKIGLAAAAGACLVLALAIGLPSLRTRVQATANATSGGPNLTDVPAFQVEVAQLNNRRWILESGGEAGSPFSNGPARRETQPAASPRSDSAKASRSDDSVDSRNGAEPPPKLPGPTELALPRPRTTGAGPTSEQLTAPSIFDGITPPIGSVSDRLASGGPEAPGIVPPQSRPAVRASALQSAILVQRVAPVYPSNAIELRLQGEVLVNATIGTDGIPKNLKVLKGDQRLVSAALAAIREWRYRPATLGGQAIETQIDVSVNFQLK